MLIMVKICPPPYFGAAVDYEDGIMIKLKIWRLPKAFKRALRLSLAWFIIKV